VGTDRAAAQRSFSCAVARRYFERALPDSTTRADSVHGTQWLVQSEKLASSAAVGAHTSASESR
jgi:hypothetical protein